MSRIHRSYKCILKRLCILEASSWSKGFSPYLWIRMSFWYTKDKKKVQNSNCWLVCFDLSFTLLWQKTTYANSLKAGWGMVATDLCAEGCSEKWRRVSAWLHSSTERSCFIRNMYNSDVIQNSTCYITCYAIFWLKFKSTRGLGVAAEAWSLPSVWLFIQETIHIVSYSHIHAYSQRIAY